MQADAPRNELALSGQPPRVRFTLQMTRAAVRQQPQALQAPQQLRYLPRVLDIRVFGDLAVARTRILSRTLQNPRGAIRQTHRHALQRIGAARADSAASCTVEGAAAKRGNGAGPGGLVRDAPPPAPDRAARSSPSTHPTDPSAARRSPLRNRAYTTPSAPPTRPSAVTNVHSPPRAPSERPSSTTAASRARISSRRSSTPGHLQRLHHTHPRQHRLAIQERRGSPTTHRAPAPATPGPPGPRPRAPARPRPDRPPAAPPGTPRGWRTAHRTSPRHPRPRSESAPPWIRP